MVKISEIIEKNKVATTLGRKTNFRGTMQFKESLRIDGKFEGSIQSDGHLYIEKGAIINADIKVGSLVIGGIVRGNVEAKRKLELLSTAKLFGNIRTAKLKIDDGVLFEGKCEMIKNVDTINIFTNKLDEIKKTVKSV